jgi:hypothetical protein
MEREDFQEISDQWTAVFDAPYIGRAELWDYGMKIGLAVFKDGEKVWESRDNVAGPLKNADVLEAFIRSARSALPVSSTQP